MNQVVKRLESALKEERLRREDFFNGTVFYFLAGRFPNLSMEMCCDAVVEVRDKLMERK